MLHQRADNVDEGRLLRVGFVFRRRAFTSVLTKRRKRRDEQRNKERERRDLG
ncbi:MAG: hypothetical protein WBW37_10605 [Methyloceanibacter sp.]